MNASPETIVRRFCEAWKRGDVEELISFFAADAVYHNIPVPPVKGAKAIREAFLGFAKLMDSIELENLNVAVNGNVVFTERIDHFRWKGKTLALPVAGVFEVRDGKITAHRDYFDYATWLNATGIPLSAS
ncbi:MAG: nuclear transport factor 2 family protein [Candidatus Binatia bacterium]|jgi:limonene-1,2-epoxide hydrolase